MRVSFSASTEGEISILARVFGGTFEPYSASNGKKVFAAMPGNLSAQELYEHEKKLTVVATWCIRLLGLILVCFSINLLFGPLTVLARLLPFLGALVETGSVLVSIILGFFLSLAVIAIAWLSYRPLIACGLFVFGLLFAVTLSFRKKLP